MHMLYFLIIHIHIYVIYCLLTFWERVNEQELDGFMQKTLKMMKPATKKENSILLIHTNISMQFYLFIYLLFLKSPANFDNQFQSIMPIIFLSHFH